MASSTITLIGAYGQSVLSRCFPVRPDFAGSVLIGPVTNTGDRHERHP